MKKIASVTFLIITSILLICYLVYSLYIKPINSMKNLDKWYEYLIVVLLLSIFWVGFYVVINKIIKLILKSIENL